MMVEASSNTYELHAWNVHKNAIGSHVQLLEYVIPTPPADPAPPLPKSPLCYGVIPC